MNGCRRLLAPLTLAISLLAPTGALAHHPAPFTAQVETGSGTQELKVHSDSFRTLQRASAGTTAARYAPRNVTASWANPVSATWCGSVVGKDDKQHAVNPAAAKQFKLIYVHGSDDTNRLKQLGDQIQSDAKEAMDFIAAASGNSKSIRFDMGTECGAQYIDILSVKLSQPRSYYKSGRTSRFERLYTEIMNQRAELGIPEQSNVILYGDHLGMNDGIIGESVWMNDDNPDPQVNAANQGGQLAALYGIDDLTDDPTWFGDYYSILHELTHSLGSVNNSAPHATGAGHCTQQHDIMCYQDQPGIKLTTDCQVQEGSYGVYDCGGDDYFNPKPAAGSYLSNHWNTYNSDFLCALAQCASPDRSAPKKLGKPRLDRNRGGQVKISWKKPAASQGVTTYQVLNNGKKLAKVNFTTRSGRVSATLGSQLRRGRTAGLTVRALDGAGNRSPLSAKLKLRVR